MDWLKFATDWVEAHPVIGSGVILLLVAFVFWVLKIPARIPRLLRPSAHFVSWRWRMFRDKIYLMRYYPDYSISSSDIICDRFDSRYKLTIQITMKFINRDTAEKVMIDCKKALIIAHLRNEYGRKMDCSLDWADGTTVIWAEPAQTIDRIDYAVSGWVNSFPRMDTRVSCEVIQLATFGLKGTRPLNLRNLPLKIILGK